MNLGPKMAEIRGKNRKPMKIDLPLYNSKIYRVFLNHWSIIDLYCGRNFDHIVSRFFAMCSHRSGYFSDMSHLIIGQIYFFVERKT